MDAESWQIDHLRLCLWEEYRFDNRPEIRAIDCANADVGRAAEGSEERKKAAIELVRLVRAARPIFEAERKEETCHQDHSWTHGILEMIDEIGDPQ